MEEKEPRFITYSNLRNYPGKYDGMLVRFTGTGIVYYIHSGRLVGKRDGATRLVHGTYSDQIVPVLAGYEDAVALEDRPHGYLVPIEEGAETVTENKDGNTK